MPPPATQTTDLRDRLRKEPYRFDFFQAIRVLRWLAETVPKSDPFAGRIAIGFDSAPSNEIVRCRSHLSHSFPQGSISEFKWPDEGDGPPEIITSFLGLTGPNGVLPRHYTQLLIDRVRDKDTTMRDFFDLFNHRVISHFYRAWEKYRLPVVYEQAFHARHDQRQRDDKITASLFSFIGLGSPSLRRRLELPDATFLYFAGHFAHKPRNAVSLAGMITDFFQVKTEVEQFVGQWLYLEADDRSSLDSGGLLANHNNQLGSNVVVGQRVWGIENRFRIRLGPMKLSQFQQYVPTGEQLTRLAQFVRLYAGAEFDFDVQLVLHKDEVPMCELGGDSPDPARLGWNTWLHGHPLSNHVDDATFSVEGCPAKMAS